MGCIMGMFFEFDGRVSLLGGFLLVGIFLWRKSHDYDLANIAGVGAVFLIALTWFERNEVRRVGEEILELPPRAATIHLKVENVFQQSDKFDRISAVGKVLQAPVEMEYLVGVRMYFLAYRSDIQQPLLPQTEIQLKGILQPVRWKQEKGSGFQEFLQRIGIHYMARRAIVSEVTKSPKAFHLFCHEANNKCQKLLRIGRKDHEDAADVHIAMMLGNRTVLEADQKDAFKHSGTMHLFAISGLHVGVIAFTLAAILRWIPMANWGRALTGISILFLYVEVTGAQPSAVRAFIMVTVFWGGTLFLRKGSPLSALVASAVIVLILDPEELSPLGFQLSYSVVAVILLYGLPLAKMLQDKVNAGLDFIPDESQSLWQKGRTRFFSHLVGVFAVCFAAMLGSTPLIVGYFQTLVLGGVFLNVMIAFLSIVTIVFGAIALIFGILQLSWLVALTNQISAWLLNLILYLVEKAVTIPGYYMHVELRRDSLAQWMVIALIAWLLLARFRRLELGNYFFWIPPIGYAIFLSLVCVPI